MEISLVAVPCNPEALVVGRSLENANARSGRKLEGRRVAQPADRRRRFLDSSEWDGAAAEASIFEHAGFDGPSTGSGQAKPDTALARKGFLAYDAAKPGEKDAYKLPFAKVVDGRLTAMPSGIRAAAARLPQADIPDDVAEKARAVIDHYEAKMKDDDGKHSRPRRAKASARASGTWPAWPSCCSASATCTTARSMRKRSKQDGSKLPAMLAEALSSLAAAFLAMSEEETRELLEGRGIAVVGEDGIELSAAAPVMKRFAALTRKAGAVLSAENRDHRDEALKCLSAMGDCMKAIDASHDECAATSRRRKST